MLPSLSVVQTNTIGPFLFTQELYKAGLIGQPGTVIANISSVVSMLPWDCLLRPPSFVSATRGAWHSCLSTFEQTGHS